MKRFVLIVLLAFTGVALAGMPMSVSFHMDQLAGNAGFVQISCGELEELFPVAMQCYFTPRNQTTVMNSIDLYVDWRSAMSPAEVAHGAGAWKHEMVGNSAVYSRLFMMEDGEAYAVFAFENIVMMAYLDGSL